MAPHALVEIAVVAVMALLCGILLQRLRQPAIVGYILAGVVLGPSGFAVIANREAVQVLAELGVLLLLFIIGMELSLRGFRRVYRVALLGSGLQILLSVGVMLLLSRIFGWETGTAILFGFIVAISSTAVAIKMLEDIGELRTDVGRNTIGVLIAQDLAIVPMLLIIDALAAGSGIGFGDVGKILAAVALLVLMIAYLTRRERVDVPFAKHIEGDVEMTALIALAYCFGAALISSLLGLSPAYGAFLAGLWIGNSTARSAVLASALPIQSVFLMVFFVSIGLLLDLSFIWANWDQVLVLLAVVTLFKTAFNIGILRLLGEPWPRAWLEGALIGQIGEFSFVLVGAGLVAGFIDPQAHKLAVSIIALSLMISPLWLMTARRAHGLAWNGITSFRQLYHELYGREVQAVVAASNRAVEGTYQLTRGIGDRGVGWLSGLLARRRKRRKAEAEAPAAAANEPEAPPARNAAMPDDADDTDIPARDSAGL